MTLARVKFVRTADAANARAGRRRPRSIVASREAPASSVTINLYDIALRSGRRAAASASKCLFVSRRVKIATHRRARRRRPRRAARARARPNRARMTLPGRHAAEIQSRTKRIDGCREHAARAVELIRETNAADDDAARRRAEVRDAIADDDSRRTSARWSPRRRAAARR